MMNKTKNIWMQLLGFEKNDPDRGASRFLEQTGFTPDSVCALLFHPDFINLYRGMDEEYGLFPDNCSYRAVIRNTERYRQDWTNYELRTLVANLKARGVDFYAGIMGSYLKDMFHREWLSDHTELRASTITRQKNLMCLKRFRDGSFYEDFFIEKLTRVLVDYGMAGVHLSDEFCPSDHLFSSDYSTDMVEQYLDFCGDELPTDVAKSMGDDSTEGAKIRQKYLWGEKRIEWIKFWEWRWEKFFRKVCDAVHAVGKKVWILGMYCSDPFETEYVYGFDTRRVMDAGVDCITANILPSSVNFESPTFPYYFHKMHMDLPMLRAQLGEKHGAVCMIGVQDASEEWSVLDHAPVRLERDIYTATSFIGGGSDGLDRAADGVFYCLGDGLDKRRWDFLRERTEIGFSEEIKCAYSPTVLWSDHAHGKMLGEYVKTRRTTPHKQAFEVYKSGTPFSGAIRSDMLSSFKGVLFVPNYDMLSKQEQSALIDGDIPFVATVPADYAVPSRIAEYECIDKYSDYPMRAFICGSSLSDADRAEISSKLEISENFTDTFATPESEVHPPIAELPYTHLSRGFIESVGIMLRSITKKLLPITSDKPMLALGLKNGYDRLYFFNNHDNGYMNAMAESALPILDATIISAYPVLPVKFFHDDKVGGVYDFSDDGTEKHKFKIKLAPDGVTIVDIKISKEENAK